MKTYRFGRPGNLASPLCLDSGSEPPARLVSKNLEDFRETQDSIGRAKNLGHSLREHLGKVGSTVLSELSPSTRCTQRIGGVTSSRVPRRTNHQSEIEQPLYSENCHQTPGQPPRSDCRSLLRITIRRLSNALEFCSPFLSYGVVIAPHVWLYEQSLLLLEQSLSHAGYRRQSRFSNACRCSSRIRLLEMLVRTFLDFRCFDLNLPTRTDSYDFRKPEASPRITEEYSIHV